MAGAEDNDKKEGENDPHQPNGDSGAGDSGTDKSIPKDTPR